MNYKTRPPFPSWKQRVLGGLAWVAWHCGGCRPCRDDPEWSIARFDWIDRHLHRELSDEELWANHEWKMALWGNEPT